MNFKISLTLVVMIMVSGGPVTAASSNSVVSIGGIVPGVPEGIVQDEGGPAESGDDRTGYLVRVSLPITNSVSQAVRQTLKRLADKSLEANRPPVVVLEFDTSGGKTGQGSDLEACQKLARYLTNGELRRIETVAYIPANRGYVGVEADGFRGELVGHAVLVVIAANQLAMEPGTAIGNAGIDEKNTESLVSAIYRDIAGRRLRLPVPVVLGMLEKERQLFRVTTSDRDVVFVDDAALQVLDKSATVESTETVCQSGEMAMLTAEQLAGFGLVDWNPDSKTDLARLIDVAPGTLDGNPVETRDWNAVQLELPMYVDRATVNWILRSLNQQTNAGVNLVILNIDGNGGDLTACFQLARQLAEYNPNEVRTVAFVRGQAKGAAGLLALSCSHLIMAPDAILGGHDNLDDSSRMSDSDLADALPLVQSIAELKNADWSMMMAMLDPGVTVTRYRNKQSGQIRLLGNEELLTLPDIGQWDPLGPIGMSDGIGAITAEQNQVARTIADNLEQIQAFYQLEQAPVQLRQSPTDQWIENVAAYLASPIVAMWLLFGAMFFFSTEMSAPGVGIPGFLATICVVLFFWSQNLGGNADWLEIILFVIGAIFILMEIFLLPGVGIFGIGGFLMVVASIVLASQSFLIPTTRAQIAQIPWSVLPVLGAGMGVVTAAIVLRNVIPRSPFLRRMMLVPRAPMAAGIDGPSDPEAMVDWSHLAGESGVTVTKLHPSGKARIHGRVYDVIANGQMVEKGVDVSVVNVQGNRVVVRPSDQLNGQSSDIDG